MDLTFVDMQHIVDQIKVRPGWYLELRPNTPNEELNRGICRLEISTDLILNTKYVEGEDGFAGQHPKQVRLFMPRYVPREAEETPAKFRDWVIYEYLWLRLHEELEWVKYPDGSPIVDPHNSDATVTGLLPPRPGEGWWKWPNDVQKLVDEAQKVIDEEFREDIDFRRLRKIVDVVRRQK